MIPELAHASSTILPPMICLDDPIPVAPPATSTSSTHAPATFRTMRQVNGTFACGQEAVTMPTVAPSDLPRRIGLGAVAAFLLVLGGCVSLTGDTPGRPTSKDVVTDRTSYDRPSPPSLEASS